MLAGVIAHIAGHAVHSTACVCCEPFGMLCTWSARLAGYSWNEIGDAGCEALARALPQMASLSTLDLGSERLARSLIQRILGFPPVRP